MLHYLIQIPANFALVLGSILVFFAPFIAAFWWRNRQKISEVKPHFNQFMEQFFLSPESNVMIIFWAAGEAIAWFVLPEFLLFLMVFMKVRHKFDLLKYDIIGTLIGTTIAVIWHAPEALLTKLPYVYPSMFTQVRDWFSHYGVLGLFFQPFSGVPFKVFNSLALDFHFFIPLFIFVALIARISRYFIAYEVTKAIYPFIHTFVRKHYAILLIVAIFVFTLLLMAVSHTYGHSS